jgi:hypothetical protein
MSIPSITATTTSNCCRENRESGFAEITEAMREQLDRLPGVCLVDIGAFQPFQSSFDDVTHLGDGEAVAHQLFSLQVNNQQRNRASLSHPWSKQLTQRGFEFGRRLWHGI